MCRIIGDSHIELPCNEVFGEEKERVAGKLSAAARSWWQSLLAEPHSFEKPTFLLGLNGWSVTNILPDGAHERTPGRIELLPNGAAGFSKVGDSMCFSLNVGVVFQKHSTSARLHGEPATARKQDRHHGAAPVHLEIILHARNTTSTAG